jgi:ATP-dependent exoDNAse (exonuclease V) beta subunit
MRPTGHQVLANVYRVCDLARAFELSGGISFRGFVDELAAQAEKADAPEALVLEEAADGVRLMTVHTAKGLEFPVVILADMTANLTAAEPDRYIDPDRGLCATRLLRCAPWELIERESEEQQREAAEGVRVAYVAATRARDLLVVPGIGDGEREGWLAPLNKALYPKPESWRMPRAAPYANFAGTRTVLDRPLDTISTEEPSIKPGLHTPQRGSHEVVWWDPAALNLNAPEHFGLRQVDLLEAQGWASASVAQYADWKTSRERDLAAGRQREFERAIVTGLEEAPPGLAPEVSVESVPRAPDRPRGARFGALLHGILRDIDFSAGAAEARDLAAMHARLLDATEAEAAAAVDAVLAAIASPLLERAKAAARCHREIPVLLPLAGGRTLEGAIDLAFLEDGAWTVVDFKSDSELASAQGRYERQAQWYCHALSQLTGLPVRAVLLRI